MTVNTLPSLDVGTLQSLLSAVNPAAILVPQRILRRIIKEDRQLAGLGLQVPHRKTYPITRERLLQVAHRDDLCVEEAYPLPDELLLLACPDRTVFETWPRDWLLVKFWRLLFHVSVDQAFARKLASGELTPAGVKERVGRLGQTEFAEAWNVLRQENFLLDPNDICLAYQEFAALFLELIHFAPHLMAVYFPAIDDYQRVQQLLAEDMDAAALLQSTRLPGAPMPVAHVTSVEDEEEPPAPPPALTLAGSPHEATFFAMLRQADAVSQKGNSVKAAVLRMRASVVSAPDLVEQTQFTARLEIERLTARLQAALALHDKEAEEWRAVLPALLEPACRGLWPAARRLLYDLQKVCLDHERDTYAVDFFEWMRSLGQKPIKRLLPNQREVRPLHHLRVATDRLAAVPLREEDRRKLSILLHAAMHHAEQRMRDGFRPKLLGVLDRVGLRPANYVEEVARRKLVEELLDRIVERGFFTMSDVRDALSRNGLKLPDLAGVGELFLGDPLIQANRLLSLDFDGVYRRGEIYVRLLQRFSSLLFGTIPGRFLTRYLILPFGGSFVLLEGLNHIVNPIARLFVSTSEPATPPPLPSPEGTGGELAPPVDVEAHVAHQAHGGHVVNLADPYAMVVVAVLILLLLYAPGFRRAVGSGLRRIGQVFKAIFFDGPFAFFRWRPVRFVLDSGPVLLFRRYLFKPLLFMALTAALCHLLHTSREVLLSLSGTVFVFSFLFLVSRLGRLAEEAFADWLARNWQWLCTDVFPGLFRLVLDLFKLLVDRTEQVLYTVDEWLRFHTGESRLIFVGKLVLNFFWSIITYVIRFAINVLIEPQLNPIKHFPVVTVSHKLVLTLGVPPVVRFLHQSRGMPLHEAVTLTTTIAFLIPGLFGYLVWELKENWKLYRSNRSPTLDPAAIGHHGETLLRFFKPGFHSGTVPRIYARLRRAARRHDGAARHRQHEALHHVEESLRRFVLREFVQLLRSCPGWNLPDFHLSALHLDTNCLEVHLACPTLGGEAMRLRFEERAGWILAGMAERGWLDRLSGAQRALFLQALTGLYKLGGVGLVHEQLEVTLAERPSRYTVIRDQLVVWPRGDFAHEQDYPLRPERGSDSEHSPVPVDRLVLARRPVTWERWSAAWDEAHVGRPVGSLLEGVILLPA
jgi:hypothetical protein